MKMLNEPRQPGSPMSVSRHGHDGDLAVLTRTNHDMRSPLSVILGVFELLEDVESLSPGERRYVGLGMKAAEDLLGLADALRLYSALQRNLVSLQPIPLDLLAAARDHLEPACGTKGFRTVTSRAGNMPVMADEGYLKLALASLTRHLTAHLLDAVPPKSDLTLGQSPDHPHHVTLHLRAGGNHGTAVKPSEEGPREEPDAEYDEVGTLNALRLIEMMGGRVTMSRRQETLLTITLPAAERADA